MDIILYAQTGCAITSCTKINDGINFELNTQNFLPPIVTGSFSNQFLETTTTKSLTAFQYPSRGSKQMSDRACLNFLRLTAPSKMLWGRLFQIL